MKIIYIHQYFLTPEEGGAIRSYHLAKGLVDAGIEVEMITAHNERTYDIRLIEGIKVHYLPIQYDNNFGFLRRVYSFLSFERAAKQLVKKLPRPDYLYITSTPLTTGMIGRWAKRKFAIPYFFEVRDLWPEAPIQMGVIKNWAIKKILYRLECQIYRDAFHLVALSPGISESIERTFPNRPITIIPNFSDPEFFDPAIASEKTRIDGIASDKITISYAGAIGPVNGLGAFLDLAKAARDKGFNWQFVIMGKGGEMQKISREKERMELDNLYLRPFGNKYDVRELLAISDFIYLSFLPHPVLTTSSPNKFFDAIAMGKPIILNFKGWIHDLVVQSGIGIYHDDNNAETVLDYISKVYINRDINFAIKQRARTLACTQFSKKQALRVLIETLKSKKSKKASGVYTLTA
ncbi:glycosyltransferase family 4 protein [Lunatibacter salilacus]|uniref:glycosyltransferase family 4 protein n=1 Tax=Lunatibacter salilacus TaxID=2483804 RepID=UPI00131C72E2|nr:glycosyltransferase family 4 protein [Lunatibacter salilacus]